MKTRLLLATEEIANAATADARQWVGTSTMFSDSKSTAALAAAEYTLNKQGLTLYEVSADKTLLEDMDGWFEPKGKHALRWCSGGMCACLGCVNHTAFYNGVTKEQWRIWLESRHPKEAARLRDLMKPL